MGQNLFGGVKFFLIPTPLFCLVFFLIFVKRNFFLHLYLKKKKKKVTEKKFQEDPSEFICVYVLNYKIPNRLAPF